MPKIEESISFDIDDDLSPSEIMTILRKLANVGNGLASGLMRHAALGRGPGAANQITQQVISMAAQADAAAFALEQQSRQLVAMPGGMPGGPIPVTRRSN